MLTVSKAKLLLENWGITQKGIAEARLKPLGRMTILLSSSSQMYCLKYTSAESSIKMTSSRSVRKYAGVLIFLMQTTLMQTVEY